jgi:hypothetical protein
MQKEEMRQIQSTHSDPLAQIVSIVKHNQLNAEHFAFALSVKEPKVKKEPRVPRKNKKSSIFMHRNQSLIRVARTASENFRIHPQALARVGQLISNQVSNTS